MTPRLFLVTPNRARGFLVFCGLSLFCFLTEATPLRYAKALVVTPQGVQIAVEVADTPQKRQRGLSFRQELLPQHGMLFVFETREKHAFWMKDMLIPLDIIWLDNQRIVHVEHSVQPPIPPQNPRTLTPRKKANFVLELAAGQAKALNLQVGQKLHYRF